MIMPGTDAIIEKGWFKAHQWLLLRRLSQILIFALFLSGPVTGLWIVKGNLASSLTLDILPLSDPFILLQTVFARHIPETVAITGALIVTGFYLLTGGRVYCAWVCPVNIVTDIAGWLRNKLDIRAGIHASRNLRYWLLAISLAVSAITGVAAWELVNPVSILQRSIIFSMTSALYIVVGMFIYDLLISKRGWCGHLCPMGAFYSLLALKAPIRVNTDKREQCNDCMDCFAVCPEPQVIRPALKGTGTPLIYDHNCTNCGRCIDVCSKHVFGFSTRFKYSNTVSSVTNREATS